MNESWEEGATPSSFVSARLASGCGSPDTVSSPKVDYAHQFNPPWTLDPARSALVVVDMQYASASRHEGLGRLLKDRGQESLGAYRFDRIETVVVPTVQRLLAGFRTRGMRVIYLTVGSALPDFSDLLPHMRSFATSIGNREGRREHEILDDLAPRPGEAVLNKTTMSAFHSSGFERLLRSWDVSQLCFTGVSTNSCVEGTARDAADRGFQALLVEDGCGAASARFHEATCENFQRLLGRVASSADVLAELAAAPARTSSR
jgi:biuret amidohydrolase